MTLQVRLVVFLISVAWLLFVLRMVKNRKIWERYAILWVGLGFAVCLMPIIVGKTDAVLTALGVVHPPSFYFLIGLLGVLLIILQCTVEITTLVRQSRDAVQDLAILRERVRHLEAELARLGSPPAARGER